MQTCLRSPTHLCPLHPPAPRARPARHRLDAQAGADYAMANAALTLSPHSFFARNTVASLHTLDGRLTLANDRLRRVGLNARATQSRQGGLGLGQGGWKQSVHRPRRANTHTQPRSVGRPGVRQVQPWTMNAGDLACPHAAAGCGARARRPPSWSGWWKGRRSCWRCCRSGLASACDPPAACYGCCCCSCCCAAAAQHPLLVSPQGFLDLLT